MNICFILKSSRRQRNTDRDVDANLFSGLVSCPLNKHAFRRRSVGCFSRRSEPDGRWRRAYLKLIREERVTWKNSQLAAAQRVAMKMGRRLPCSSVTYQFRYAPSSRLAGGSF